MAFVMCVRNKKRTGFGNEPGATQYLNVPKSAKTHVPDHKITKTEWIKMILKEAEYDTENGTPVGDILFYVHGFNNTPKNVLERHRKIEKGLQKHGYRGAVVSFDWPSANTALNYLEDRHDAKQTLLRLVKEGIATFSRLQKPHCRINQHILAHSMGCYVVREAFDDADDVASIAAKNWNVSQVMFIGADVSSWGLRKGAAKSSSLYRHCVRFTNYYTPYDNILKLSNTKRIGVSPRAGRIGLPDNVPRKAVDVYCGAYYKKHIDPDLKSLRKPHTWYFDDDRLLQDINYTIAGNIDRHDIPGRAMTDKGNLALNP